MVEQKSYVFQGCAEIMSGLHFVRTGIPDTPKTPLSAFSFHEYYSDTPRHHPDIPKTTPRHLQGTQDVNKRQHAPTDTSRHMLKNDMKVFNL